MRSFVHRWIRSAGRRALGVEITNCRHSLRALRQRVLRGRNVTLIIDVGANRGQYFREVRKDGYKGRLVSIEPLRSPFATLWDLSRSDPLLQCFNVALGSATGTAVMNVARESAASSLLEFSELLSANPSTERVRCETVNVDTLDSLMTRCGSQRDQVYVKVDVQGYEYEVLKGAENTLRDAVAVEVEMSLAQLYEGQVLFPELSSQMTFRGFELWHVEPEFTDLSSGRILQVNGLFLKTRLSQPVGWRNQRTPTGFVVPQWACQSAVPPEGPAQ